MQQSRLIVIILAAGQGTRMKSLSTLPKPLISIKGRTLLDWSLASLRPLVSNGVLSVDDIYIASTEKIIELIKSFSYEIHERFNSENMICIHESKSPVETLTQTIQKLKEGKKISTRSSLLVMDADHYFRLPSNTMKELLRNNSSNTVGVWTTNKEPKDLSWCFLFNDKSSREKLIEKPTFEQAQSINTSKGIIGAYFFSNFDFLTHLLNCDVQCAFCTENTECEFISSFINHLILSGWSLEDNQASTFIPMGNPDQYTLAEQTIHSEIGIYDEPTIFLDFDGTIMRHDANEHEFCSAGLSNRIESIKQMQEKGSQVIVTTARNEEDRHQIEQFLERCGLAIHTVICGVNGGNRWLVNDTKPFASGIETAQALNVVRNSNSEIPLIFDWNMFPRLQKVSDLSGASGAKTELFLRDGKFFVRKSTYSEEMSRKLSYQVKWHNFVTELNLKSVTPIRILNQTFTNIPNTLSYYDSDYVSDSCSIYEAVIQEKVIDPETFVLHSLSALHNETKSEQVSVVNSLKTLWKTKVIPVVDKYISQNQSYGRVKLEDLLRKLDLLSAIIENNPKSSKFVLTGSQALVHGDPTFENLGFSSGKLVFFDPIGTLIDPLFDSHSIGLGKTYPVFDYSRVFISKELHYEQWRTFDVGKSNESRLETQFSSLRNNLKSICDEDFSHDCLELIVLSDLIRIFKYKTNSQEKIVCISYVNEILNLVLS